MLEGEQQQQGDQQRKDAERLGHREAENEVAELALRGGRIAQRGGEIMAEDGATPTPAPPMPMQAMPAPIIFAA